MRDINLIVIVVAATILSSALGYRFLRPPKWKSFTSSQYDRSTPLEISISPRWWPLFQSDFRWFLPRFKLSITNKGNVISRGSVELDITKQGISEYKNCANDTISNLAEGNKHEFTFGIASHFLPQPGSYELRVMVLRFVPRTQPPMERLEQLLDQPGISETKKPMARAKLSESLKRAGLDPNKPEPGLWGERILEGKWSEVIKIHPLKDASALTGTVLGALLAFLGWVFIKLLSLLS